ncbi:MAG: hypothetical protein QOC90_2125 [Mycobacterium sp.]|jgi:benzil reductase ((S)-benzoin forming)|nr:hypothetical protein [Mycobacterium sp.]
MVADGASDIEDFYPSAAHFLRRPRRSAFGTETVIIARRRRYAEQGKSGMKILIISGGSRGLGLELCRYYIEHGFRVLEFSRSAPHDYSVKVDFTLADRSRAVVKTALAALPDNACEEIVVVANAAMVTPIGPTSRQDPASILRTINASYVSAVLFITEAIARFQAVTCRKILLNISSGGALRGQAGLSLYCGAKAGLENFVRAVALEQAAEAAPFVAVNVDPGAMNTDMQAALVQASKADFPDVERFVERKTNGTLRVPARVAAATARIADLPDLVSGNRYNVGDYGV